MKFKPVRENLQPYLLNEQGAETDAEKWRKLREQMKTGIFEMPKDEPGAEELLAKPIEALKGVPKEPGHRQETDPTKITQQVDQGELSKLIAGLGDPEEVDEPTPKPAPEGIEQKTTRALSELEVSEMVSTLTSEMRNGLGAVIAEPDHKRAYRALMAWCTGTIGDLEKLIA